MPGIHFLKSAGGGKPQNAVFERNVTGSSEGRKNSPAKLVIMKGVKYETSASRSIRFDNAGLGRKPGGQFGAGPEDAQGKKIGLDGSAGKGD